MKIMTIYFAAEMIDGIVDFKGSILNLEKQISTHARSTVSNNCKYSLEAYHFMTIQLAILHRVSSI